MLDRLAVEIGNVDRAEDALRSVVERRDAIDSGNNGRARLAELLDKIPRSQAHSDSIDAPARGIAGPLADVGLNADLLLQLVDLGLQLGDAFDPFRDVLDLEQVLFGEIGDIRDRDLRTEPPARLQHNHEEEEQR